MEYNVGDLLWWAKADIQQVSKKCPVCFGNLYVVVTLGDGEQVRTECGYCGKGYEGPRGYLPAIHEPKGYEPPKVYTDAK